MLTEDEFIELAEKNGGVVSCILNSYQSDRLETMREIKNYLINEYGDIKSISDVKKKLLPVIQNRDFNFDYDKFRKYVPWYAFVTKIFFKDAIDEEIDAIAWALETHIQNKEYLKISEFQKIMLGYNYESKFDGTRFVKKGRHQRDFSSVHLAGFFACKHLTIDDYDKIYTMTLLFLEDCQSKEVILRKLRHSGLAWQCILNTFVISHATLGARLFYYGAFQWNWGSKINIVWSDIIEYINKNK